MNDPTQLRQRMGELGVQFLQRTQQEAATLRELLGKVQDGDCNAFQQIEYLGHRICGTGATLGFAQISEHASQIERLAEGRTTADAAILQQLQNCVDDLDRALSAALK